MANTLTGLIPTLYEALDSVSREQVGMIPAVARNASADMLAVGQTERIPIAPSESTVDITAGVTAPDSGDQTISYVDMQITKSKMVPVRFNGEETKGLNGMYSPIVRDRFLQAFRAIANEVEADLTALHTTTSRAYGTAATTPFASSIIDAPQMRKILVDNGASTSNLRMVVDSTAGANLRTLGQFTYVNQAGTDSTLRQGVLGNISGFGVGESSQILTPTAGTAASSTTDATGYAVGSTVITLAAIGTGTILAGDVITFAGDTNKYVVASGDANVADGGTITLAAPGLRVALPAAATAITVIAASARNLAFDSTAIQLMTRAPAMPEGGDQADDVTSVTDPISGLTFQVAVYRQYRQVHYEVGLAWGVKNIKPEHTAILLG